MHVSAHICRPTDVKYCALHNVPRDNTRLNSLDNEQCQDLKHTMSSETYEKKIATPTTFYIVAGIVFTHNLSHVFVVICHIIIGC